MSKALVSSKNAALLAFLAFLAFILALVSVMKSPPAPPPQTNSATEKTKVHKTPETPPTNNPQIVINNNSSATSGHSFVNGKNPASSTDKDTGS
ncbi:hypothetical protein [Cylindrospermum sp. FACHB-282]|uniref:hypothetical protein n=1 Tax=Cylindrospermum sp. FACHB-282 TaxID=2692794 RepID=UPI001681EEC0|nr:hypothetical protein [Cylindrospermum sp. FACHB-282]